MPLVFLAMGYGWSYGVQILAPIVGGIAFVKFYVDEYQQVPSQQHVQSMQIAIICITIAVFVLILFVKSILPNPTIWVFSAGSALFLNPLKFWFCLHQFADKELVKSLSKNQDDY